MSMQYFLDYPTAAGHNFFKSVSDNPKRPVNQNYPFGHQCTRKKAKIIRKCSYHTQVELLFFNSLNLF